MFKPPRRVKLFGTVYTVRLVKNEIKDPDAKEGTVGLCDKEKKIIWIKDEGPMENLDTYNHECFHALVGEARADNIITGKQEEYLANLCGRGYTEAFQAILGRARRK